MSYVLAVDQGTQSTRAAVLDMHGRILAMESYPITSTNPKDGWIEQDAAQIVRSTTSAIDQVWHAIPATVRSSIDFCGIATQRSSVLCWDEKGHPGSPVLNWQDTRGKSMLDNMHVYEDEIRRISGLPLSAHYGATKLCWLIDNSDYVHNHRIGPISSYLLASLTNTDIHAVDHGNAQRMQLWDTRTIGWSERLSDLFGIPRASLPVSRPIYHNFGKLRPWGIPITAMNGDQNAAWFGSGRPGAGTALVNIGSGAFVLTTKHENTDLPQLINTVSFSEESNCEYLLEATVNGAGNALQWLARNFKIKEYRALLQHSLERIADPPIFLNTVGGLGSPWWKPGPDPVFNGDPASYSHSEMLAAVCESILFLVYRNILLIQQHQPITGLQLGGGLSNVDRICQKLANLTNLKVCRNSEPESTIRGIAWIAAGQTKTWGISEQDVFLPESDPGLNTRFRLFIELLAAYIEDTTRK